AALTQATFDMRERAVLRHTDNITGIDFSPDGHTLATASWDGTARLWDTDTGEERASLEHEGVVESAAFSPDGRTLATASRDGKAQLWDAATGQQRTSLQHQTQYVREAVFSPDGRILAIRFDEYGSSSSLSRHPVRLVDPATGTDFAVLEHPDSINSI